MFTLRSHQLEEPVARNQNRQQLPLHQLAVEIKLTHKEPRSPLAFYIANEERCTLLCGSKSNTKVPNRCKKKAFGAVGTKQMFFLCFILTPLQVPTKQGTVI